MTAILAVAIIAAISSIVYSMWLFDCLVRWEYDHHREQWELDGKPDGFFWRPKESAFWSSDIAKKRLHFEWIFSAPAWISGNQETRRWLTRMRIVFCMANAAVLALAAKILLR